RPSMVSRYSSTGGWYSWGSFAMAVVRRGWHVEGGIAIEEADRDEAEAGVLHRHDRPILGARQVGHAEGVPHHDVGVDDLAILGRPFWQSGPADMLIGVVTGRAAL